MEVSALRYTGGIGLHGRSPLLRLQSDERLIALVRRGNPAAFEVLVARYQSRLLAFCRHLLGSREDAEDVLQEALAAAFNAILADDRPINVRPWLYRIARNRCLNHLRRIQAVGVDSMDVHLSEHGASTADKVHKLEEFWMLVGDIRELPETQKTALVLREMDALSYEQIAEAMETTVPSVKSLLVRARVSLAEAAEARMLTCEEVRVELAEAAEGLRKRTSPVVRRHLRACERCSVFQVQLKETSKALTAVLPIGPLVLVKKLFFAHLGFAHLGHSAGASAGAGSSAAGPAAAVGSTAAAGTAVVSSGAGSVISVGVGAIATKAAAGLAAAALVTAGAVEVEHGSRTRPSHATPPTSVASGATAAGGETTQPQQYHSIRFLATEYIPAASRTRHTRQHAATKAADKRAATKTTMTTTTTAAAAKLAADRRHNRLAAAKGAKGAKSAKTTTPAGRTETQTQTTVLASGQTASSTGTTTGPSPYGQSPSSGSTTSTTGQPTTSSTPSSTTTTSSSPSPDTTGSGTGGSAGSDSGGSAPSGGSGTGTTTGPTTTTTTPDTTTPAPTPPTGGAADGTPAPLLTTPAG